MPGLDTESIEFTNVRGGFFRLAADARCLSALVGSCLNLSGSDDETYELVQGAVCVYAFQGCHRLASDVKTFSSAVFLTIDVRAVTAGNTLCFCPCVFVDDPHLLSSLRERFGYTAWRAQIDIEVDAAHLGLTVTTEVYSQGSNEPKREAILRVEASDFTGNAAVEWPLPLRSVQLFQIREAAEPSATRLRRPVTTPVATSGNATRYQSPKSIMVKVVQGFRTLDLCADLGLTPPDAVPCLDCAMMSADTLSIGPADLPKIIVIPSTPGPIRRFFEPRVDPRTPPPYAFDGVTITGFKVPADIVRLQDVVDALLNANPELGDPRQNYRYRVATSEIVVERLYYPRMRSKAETEERKSEDITWQYELVFRLLVGKMEEDADTATDPQIFCPFLFVDNWVSMVTGREVIGVWKRIAKFENHRHGDPSNAERASRTDAFEITLPEVEQPVLRIVAPPLFPSSSWQSLPDLQGSRSRGVLPWTQTDLGRAPEFRRGFARDWLRLNTEEFSAVQRFNLPQPGEYWPYRRLVESRYRVRNFNVCQPTEAAYLEFGNLVDRELAQWLHTSEHLRGLGASVIDPGSGKIDIAKLLGLGDGPTVKVPPGSWYESKGDIELDIIDPLG